MAKRHRGDISPEEVDDSGNIVSIGNINTANHASPIDISDDVRSLSSNGTSKKINRIDSKFANQTATPIITCNFLPNCNLRPFSSYAEFESHYSQQHMNRCLECHRNFPSERYLSIHIAENHDVFAQLKKERGEKTFACFVDGCDRMCSTPQKRRLHVIDKHGFPKDFYFRVVDHGIDHCNSLLRKPRRFSKSNTQQQQQKDNSAFKDPESEMALDEPTPESYETDNTEEEQEVEKSKEVNMDDVTDLMAGVKLIPRSVKFGRGGANVGFVPRR